METGNPPENGLLSFVDRENPDRAKGRLLSAYGKLKFVAWMVLGVIFIPLLPRSKTKPFYLSLLSLLPRAKNEGFFFC